MTDEFGGDRDRVTAKRPCHVLERIRFREQPSAWPTVHLAVSTYDEELVAQIVLLTAQVTP